MGVYLYGSQAQGEGARRSDIDILVLAAAALTAVQKQDLAAQLDHAMLPVPAMGLELMVVETAIALNLPRPLRVAFALTTGATWPTDIQDDVEYEELLLDIAMVRESGRALFGPPPREAFAEGGRARLLEIVERALEWHRPRLLDPLHDPLGQNSVLNAARAWRYVEDGTLVSKTQGGRWMAKKPPYGELAARALAIRNGGSDGALDASEIDALLAYVIDELRVAK